MRLFVVVIGALALGLSSAIAAPPPGKGKPEWAGKPATAGKPSTTGPLCKPKVTVVLKGTLTSSGTGSLAMQVKQDDLGWSFNPAFFGNLYDELQANPKGEPRL